MRRRLSDITNTQSQSKFVGLIEEQPRIPECTQDLIDQLLLVRSGGATMDQKGAIAPLIYFYIKILT